MPCGERECANQCFTFASIEQYRCVFYFQSLVEKVKADMEWCLAKCHHNDQSLNFGKCLLHVSDMACTDQGGVGACLLILVGYVKWL